MVGKKTSKKRNSSKKKASSRTTALKQKEKTIKSYGKKFHHKIKEKLNIHHEFPLGIRVFLTYLAILSLFYIFAGFTTKTAVVMGISFSGTGAILFNFLIALILCGLIYGFAKKDIRYYYTSLIFFTLILVNALLSIFAIRSGLVGTIRDLVNIIFFLTILLNIITLVFIISKKYYFLHPKPEYHVHRQDKMFIGGLFIIWILILASSGFFVNKYYKESFPRADRILVDLEDEGVLGAMDYCERNQDPDLCNYIGAIMNKEDPNARLLCERIRLSFFYNDCVKSIENEDMGLMQE